MEQIVEEPVVWERDNLSKYTNVKKLVQVGEYDYRMHLSKKIDSRKLHRLYVELHDNIPVWIVGQICVRINESSKKNPEFAHRLGLIPVDIKRILSDYQSRDQKFDPNFPLRISFVGPGKVMSSQLTELKYTGGNALLCCLGENKKLVLDCYLEQGTAKQHTCFSCISRIKINQEEVNAFTITYTSYGNVSPEEIVEFTNKIDTDDGNEYLDPERVLLQSFKGFKLN